MPKFCHGNPLFVIADPAEYGNPGAMSLTVNHDGKVFSKDLGKRTVALAQCMKEYDPDETWTEVGR